MAEQFSLTTPVTPVAPTTSSYSIRSLYLGWDEAQIRVVLRDNNGATSHYTYDGPQATSLMVALNKANLSANSLQKRVINQLVGDGKLAAGSVTGTPD